MTAVGLEDLLRSARRQGATVARMRRVLGCSQYRFYQLKRDGHWFAVLLIAEAARRAVEAAGGVGLQTHLLHFTGVRP